MNWRRKSSDCEKHYPELQTPCNLPSTIGYCPEDPLIRAMSGLHPRFLINCNGTANATDRISEFVTCIRRDEPVASKVGVGICFAVTVGPVFFLREQS